MQKVISINLNGNAYHLEERGYEVLSAYLAGAAQQLEGNPDRAEIMADLEQAIADKCQRYLTAQKSVVTVEEVDRIVAEMGPVDAATGDPETEEAAGTTNAQSKKNAAPKRLYRIMDGAMIGGVCTGLAAYFQVDATIVRIAFVVAALLTKGFAIGAYIILMFVIPEAKTPEARAAATGAPLNARDIVERAKQQYAEGKKEWRRQWREQRRQWQRHGWTAAAQPVYPPMWAVALLPVFTLAHLALFLLMVAAMISLVNTGSVLDWDLPPDVPLWAAVLILLVGYQIAVGPIRAVHHWATVPRPGAQPAWFVFWNGVAWLMGVAFLVWVASNNLPEIREFLQHLPELLRDFGDAVRDFVDRAREAR